MNQCIFMGRAVGDPETRYSGKDNNLAITNLTLAVSRRYKREGEPEADFFKCVAFGKTAQSIEKYVVKGVKIIVIGEMQNDNYEKDGVKHYQMKLVVSSWEFAESKKSATESGEETPEKNSGDDFMPIPKNLDIDMPFA